MSQLNKLYRNFIILQEDERGYSNSNDKTLSGYSKIEARGDTCKISFYAQNLRNDDDDDYCILAICNKKDTKKIVDLGKITISDGGKAEITKEYSVDDIAGLGISYDKVSGAAIAKMKNKIPIIIMCGFINGEQPSENWKNYKIVKSAHEKIKDKIEYIKKDEKKKKDEDKYHEKKKCDEEKHHEDKKKEKKCDEHRDEDIRGERPIIDEIDSIDPINIEDEKHLEESEEVVEEPTNLVEIVSADNPFINQKVEENPFANKTEDIDYYGMNSLNRDGNHDSIDEEEIINEDNQFTEQEIGENQVESKEENINQYEMDSLNRGNKKNKFDEYEEKIDEKIEDNIEEEPKVFTIRGSVGEYFEGIANGFEHCRGEYQEIKYCKWYKVPVHDLHEMCNMSNYNRYTVAYYPMLNYYPYIRKYGHFMLGYKCDKDGNLRYIVYGIPGKKNRDEQPYEGKTGFVTWINDETRDGMGCWLMFYDFRNSTVVVPMQ